MKMKSVVGIFVLIGLICVGYLTIKLGKMEVFDKKGYTVTAVFSSVAGLRVGADVEIAGVSVGKVTAIRLDGEAFMARVDLRLDDGVVLGNDTMASVRTSGLIGDKYIGLEPGGSDSPLKEGSVITDTESAFDLESVIGKVVFGGV